LLIFSQRCEGGQLNFINVAAKVSPPSLAQQGEVSGRHNASVTPLTDSRNMVRPREGVGRRFRLSDRIGGCGELL
jgi:hypothetical protein